MTWFRCTSDGDHLTSITPVLASVDKFSGQATYNLDNPTRKATLVNWITIDNSDNRVVDINGQAFGGKYAFGDASKANVLAGCYGFGYIPDAEDTIICGFQRGDGGMYARGAFVYDLNGYPKRIEKKSTGAENGVSTFSLTTDRYYDFLILTVVCGFYAQQNNISINGVTKELVFDGHFFESYTHHYTEVMQNVAENQQFNVVLPANVGYGCVVGFTGLNA